MDMNLVLETLIDDSSDDDDIDMIENSSAVKPPLPLLLDDADEEDENLDYVVEIIECTAHLMKRINRIKVINYVEITRNYSNDDFITHFRLSRTSTYQLIEEFQNSEQFKRLKDTSGKEVLTAECHILTFLWYAGHQTSSYRDVADRFAITRSTLFEVISRVTKFLLSIGPSIIKFPTPQEREKIAQEFKKLIGIRGIIGAMGGTHIRIDRPSDDVDSFINKNQYFSFQIQGLVDNEGNFMHVFVGHPGSVHSAKVFRESDLFDKLDDICGDGKFIIANSAYPCQTQVIVPYEDDGHLNKTRKIFNEKLNLGTIIVEHAFGSLKERFPRLYHLKLRDFSRMKEFVHACCILHNLASANDLSIFGPSRPDDPDLIANQPAHKDEQRPANELDGIVLRDELCRPVAANC